MAIDISALQDRLDQAKNTSKALSEDILSACSVFGIAAAFEMVNPFNEALEGVAAACALGIFAIRIRKTEEAQLKINTKIALIQHEIDALARNPTIYPDLRAELIKKELEGFEAVFSPAIKNFMAFGSSYARVTGGLWVAYRAADVVSRIAGNRF